MSGCHRKAALETGPLVQRGYLWQRDWTPEVKAAVRDAQSNLEGLVMLGAEIHWNGNKPEVIRIAIPWESLKQSRKPCSVALRIDPFSGPFATSDSIFEMIVKTATSLVKAASDQGIELKEFQLDFDCAQNKLAGYRIWVERLREAIHPIPLIITTLPSWLKEGEFLPLVESADGYVLQVHSVPTREETGRSVLCDPALARKWVAKASALGLPFSVSLPTYHALAGYAPSGKLLGVLMDSVQPSWPPDTRTLDFSADADQIAGLVKEWRISRPAGMKELIWYRIPVETDQQNWHWPTLDAVMQGRAPTHHLEVIARGDTPIDLSILNTGEAEELVHCTVTVSWTDVGLISSDALPGWSLDTGKEQAEFKSTSDRVQRLSPGERIGIGWLRFNKPTTVKTNVQ